MRLCHTVDEIRQIVAELRQDGGRIGLVPTMGALHAGHLALVAEAHRHTDHIIATIFVNPTQFGNPEDLDKYPRTMDDDLAKLEAASVSAVFSPTPGEIYPDGAETIVETTRLANMLHGLVRPGHFRGVTTVVNKLFNIIVPDVACFGEKDYQQLVVIRQMVRDLFMPVEIIGVPTQRETDGLAMSSRNVRLTPEDRVAAIVLSKSLNLAEQMVERGTTVEALKTAVTEHIQSEPRADVKAVDITNPDLSPASGPINAPVALMISAEFGGILLLDQRVASPRKER